MRSLHYYLFFLTLAMISGIACAQTPQAAFGGIPVSGTSPLTVSFTDSSPGIPTGWAWYFGDESFTSPWTQQTSSAGWARTSLCGVAMPDGSIVLTGGSNGSYLNDTWRSTNKGLTWTRVNASSGWVARYSHNMVVVPNGSIVLFGGNGNYSSQTVESTRMQLEAGIAGYGSQMFVGAPPFPGSYQNDTWISTNNGTTWTRVNASSGWTARYVPSSVVLPDGSIVLTGGYDGSYLNDTWRSIDRGTSWTQMTAHAEWSNRSGHSSVALPDGSIVLMGGFDVPPKNDTWRSTNGGATWTQMTAHAGWKARYGHTSGVLPDGSIVLMGGFDGSTYYNDMWRSTDLGATWTQVRASSEYTARYMHSSVVLPDSSIVLMGGYYPYGNDVWRFVSAGSSSQSPSHTYTATGIYPVALQVYNGDGYNSTRKTAYITVTSGSGANATDNVGIFRPSTGYWYFDYNLDGIVNKSFRYGGSTDQIIKGDWQGTGNDGIGIPAFDRLLVFRLQPRWNSRQVVQIRWSWRPNCQRKLAGKQ
jgi:hypothetical protein